MDSVERFLAVVRQELSADDARLELGGRAPRGTSAVWVELGDGWRLVALFEQDIDDVEERHQKLATLVASFHGTLEELRREPRVPAVRPEATARSELRLCLDVLCEKAKAAAAIVVDEQSPVVWGTSTGAAWLDDAERGGEIGSILNKAANAGFDAIAWLGATSPATPALPKDVREELVARRSALRLLVSQTAAPAARLAVLRALALAREEGELTVRGDDFSAITRRFGGIYLLALAFEGPYSELHADTTLARALPSIERLVRDLPPIDPTPQGARIFTLPPRRP
jgi:hypothetical protein